MALSNIQIGSRPANISDFSIAQIRLLFKYFHGDDIHHLAYIQHFKMLNVRNAETGMHVLERTNLYEVVPITNIVQNVHLIPYFETVSSACNALKAKRDEYSFLKYLLNHFGDTDSSVYFH